jgi:hypothetical protein
MSMMCDSCKQIVNEENGHARISISDPSPDFSAAVISMPRRPPTIDLCATCLLKLIASLALPPDTFTPRAPRVEPTEPTPMGALTQEDLVRLGLKETP